MATDAAHQEGGMPEKREEPEGPEPTVGAGVTLKYSNLDAPGKQPAHLVPSVHTSVADCPLTSALEDRADG